METLWTRMYHILRDIDADAAKRGADAAMFALAAADAEVLFEQHQRAADNAYWNQPNVRWVGHRAHPHGPIDLRAYYAAVASQYSGMRHIGDQRAAGLPIRDWVRTAFGLVECPAGVDPCEPPTDAECDHVYDRYVDSI